jgi:uncharacterized protein YutE (UPF0331/DUF86 family)
MPPDRRFVEDSLAALEENLSFLVTLGAIPEAEFKQSKLSTYSAAYALMICIESVSGIASHLLATLTTSSPTGMAHSFELLLQEGVLKSPSLAAELAKMSRFRNLIVHRYWKVDYGQVHEILTSHLQDFRDFAIEIQRFLEEENL